MALALFVLIQTLATAFGSAFLWRRHEAMRAEIAALNRNLQASQARVGATKPRVVEIGASAASEPPQPRAEPPIERARRRWRLSSPAAAKASEISPDTIRGAALAAAILAPALTLLFGADAATVCAVGVFVAAALMLVAMRLEWAMTAWFAIAAAASWLVIGLASGTAVGSPLLFSIAYAVLAAAALVHARLRRSSLGWFVVLAGSGACLLLAQQAGAIGPAGAALAFIIATSALVGASTLKLEPLLVGAFAVAGAALFVLSGQHAAAIWFTPAAALAGALFLAIAAVRTPQLGPRGAVVAGVGALGAIASTYLLHASGQALADNLMAAAAFAGIAVVFGVIIAAAWARRPHGDDALKLTLWILALGALYATLAAIDLAAPAPLAASLSAGVAVGVLAINARWPATAWRACAIGALVACAAHAAGATQMLLSEAPRWPDEALIGLGLAGPAIMAAFAARLADHNKGSVTAALAEAVTFTLAIAAVNLSLRLACSNGAFLLAPISFVEACGHVAIWLAAALIIGTRVKRGAGALRRAFTAMLSAAAFVAAAAVSLVWFGAFWEARAAMAPVWLSHAPLGFLVLFLGFGAHWVFWRGRRAEIWTRASFAMSALTGAGFIMLEAFGMTHDTAVRAVVIALATSAAVAINFAPGVTLGAEPRHPIRVPTD